MKTCLVSILCLVFITSVLCARNPDRQMSRRRAALRCIRESKIKYSAVKRYQKGDFSDESEKSKCFLKCFGAKVGMFQTEEGDTYEINEEFIKKYLDDIVLDSTQIPVIVDKCKAAEKGESVCDYAFNAYRCFYAETSKKPDLIDNSESSFDTINDEDFYLRLGFGLEGTSDDDLIAELIEGSDIDKEITIEKITGEKITGKSKTTTK